MIKTNVDFLLFLLHNRFKIGARPPTFHHRDQHLWVNQRDLNRESSELAMKISGASGNPFTSILIPIHLLGGFTSWVVFSPICGEIIQLDYVSNGLKPPTRPLIDSLLLPLRKETQVEVCCPSQTYPLHRGAQRGRSAEQKSVGGIGAPEIVG